MSFARISGFVVAFSLAGISSLAQFMAPPPNPPVIGDGAVKKAESATAVAEAGAAPFSIGDPTDEEQLYLELINRARANPPAEANRILSLDAPDIVGVLSFFSVDTNLFKAQLAAISPLPPLSFNAKLITSARGQSQFQFDNGVQTHSGPGGNTLTDRFAAVGYSFSSGGENVYSYADNVEHGHAGFEVDWGQGTGGMQTPPGHRNNIHSVKFTEVGVGIVNGHNQVGANTPVGAQVVTEDFGTPATQTTYITGVAYYDLNGNNFYDIGEGLSGVTVTVDGLATYAVTSNSGGYSIPVPANHVYSIRMNAIEATEVSATIFFNGTNNVKFDYQPAYVPPTLTSSSAIFAGASNAMTFSKVGGATAYAARVYTFQSAAVEGAETVTNIAFNTTAGYSATSTTVKAAGAASFHLAHIDRGGGSDPQSFQIKTPFVVQAGATLSFKSKIAIAYAGGTNGAPEVAKVQVSSDDGQSWNTVWSQNGLTTDQTFNSESSFNVRSVDLSPLAGKLVLVRFLFDLGRLYYTASDTTGWYIDDITVTSPEAVNPTVTALDNTGTFGFTPAIAGNYGIQFAATAGARTFPFGPIKTVTAAANPPVYSMAAPIISGANVTLHFTRTSGSVTGVAIETAANVAGPWSTDGSANITGPVRDEYIATLSVNGSARFYRVISQ